MNSKKDFFTKVAAGVQGESCLTYRKSKMSWVSKELGNGIFCVLSFTVFSKNNQNVISGVHVELYSSGFNKWKGVSNSKASPVWGYGIKLNKLQNELTIEFLGCGNDEDVGNAVSVLLKAYAYVVSEQFDLDKVVLFNLERSKALGKRTRLLEDLLEYKEYIERE